MREAEGERSRQRDTEGGSGSERERGRERQRQRNRVRWGASSGRWKEHAEQQSELASPAVHSKGGWSLRCKTAKRPAALSSVNAHAATHAASHSITELCRELTHSHHTTTTAASSAAQHDWTVGWCHGCVGRAKVLEYDVLDATATVALLSW